MLNSIFISDLHGNTKKYEKLFQFINENKPDIVFIGGDLLPAGNGYYKGVINNHKNFIAEFLIKNIESLRNQLKESFPKILLILGNDDARCEEKYIIQAEELGLWKYINQKSVVVGSYKIFGYNFVPPTPFRLKDWEKYDISRFVDIGCISPEEGSRTVEISKSEMKFSTIKEDLEKLTKNEELGKAVFLFHAPPHKTNLDRAALDNKVIDHVQVDVNVGSIAIRKFIEDKQPMLTLHGHIHESTELTGEWRDKIGKTICFNASSRKSKLSIIKFQLDKINNAERILI